MVSLPVTSILTVCQSSSFHNTLVYAEYWTKSGFQTICDVTNHALPLEIRGLGEHRENWHRHYWNVETAFWCETHFTQQSSNIQPEEPEEKHSFSIFTIIYLTHSPQLATVVLCYNYWKITNTSILMLVIICRRVYVHACGCLTSVGLHGLPS